MPSKPTLEHQQRTAQAEFIFSSPNRPCQTVSLDQSDGNAYDAPGASLDEKRFQLVDDLRNDISRNLIARQRDDVIGHGNGAFWICLSGFRRGHASPSQVFSAPAGQIQPIGGAGMITGCANHC